ncbi:hypothetical protein MLD38_010636 [Melastoma candidum]|uniref:Uncharacterized protein n=1 Tax=Melastoma candidum TaxID=119954 RepID=A0ACB9R1J8_9MYRT|nr:hypothetical protein MLD38_010636 [Melastoma candidum]
MDNSRNWQDDHLGVNKIGKNIRKSPLHQPNFANNNGNYPNGSNDDGNASRQPQPQVYNIDKNDFRSVVQHLTGSPACDRLPLPRPPNNPPKPQSMRLQKIRPTPLSPMRRPQFPPLVSVRVSPPPVPYHNTNFAGAAPYGRLSPRNFQTAAPYGQPSPRNFQTVPPGAPPFVGNTNECPISAYMRYLQTPLVDPASGGDQLPYQPSQHQILPPPAGLHLNPHWPMLPSPRMTGPMPYPPFHSVSSPQMNGVSMPALLPSPTSQFLLPSPSNYLNLQSPRSSYPLLSPGFQFPLPFPSSFLFSPMTQPGILGPGPQPPPSPGMFPLSPVFSALPSPRWRDQ